MIDGRRVTSCSSRTSGSRPGRAGTGRSPRAASTIASTCSAGIVRRSSSSSSEMRGAEALARAVERQRLELAQLGGVRRGQHAVGDIGVGRRGRRAEVAEEVDDDVVGDLRVALAAHDVHDRLRADELRERRDHDRPAELGAHAAGLLERGLEQLGAAHLLELAAHRRDHAAGHLVGVVARRRTRPACRRAAGACRARARGSARRRRERVEVERVREAGRLEVAQRRLGTTGSTCRSTPARPPCAACRTRAARPPCTSAGAARSCRGCAARPGRARSRRGTAGASSCRRSALTRPPGSLR